MSENTALWDKLGKTDPSHTKQFTRAGGFKGTAIKPMWSYRRMTEEFGPCGIGWGINEPKFDVVPAGDEVLVYCTVSIWYNGSHTNAPTGVMESVYGVGGDKVLSKTANGPRSDDEAFKKAYTDAVTNALKMIGVGADVHMGMFDDNKYVNSMREEFAGNENDGEPRTTDRRSQVGKQEADRQKPISAAEQKRQLDEIERELLDCHSLVAVDKCAASWSHIAGRDGWSKDYKEAARNKFDSRRQAVSQSEAA